MSAFVVDPLTIDRIASHVIATYDAFVGIRTSDPDAGDRIGELLLKVNVDAVNYRYREDDPVPEYHYTPRPPCGRVQTYKSIQCLIYQCSEGEQFETSPVYVALELARDRLAHAIVCDLPAYEGADWA
jgi:hypothetical protein